VICAARPIRHPSKGEYDHVDVPACDAELSVIESHHARRVGEEVLSVRKGRGSEGGIDVDCTAAVGRRTDEL